MRKLALAVFMSLIGAAFVAQPAAAQGTLTGETLTCSPASDPPDPPNDRGCRGIGGESSQVDAIEVSCSDSGGSFEFRVEGFAAGPYPGTFTETGSAKLGPPERGIRQLLEVQATFRIESPQGLVTGTKHLPEPPPLAGFEFGKPHFGLCFEGQAVAIFEITLPSFEPASLCYRARLPDGSSDFGLSGMTLGDGPLLFDQFVETFASDPAALACFEPETRDDCKAGGAFEDSPLFKNQGDCVAFVASGGKNEPQKNQKNP